MGILSVTHIAGTRRSGKSMIAAMFNAKPNYYVVDENHHLAKTKESMFKLLDEWKKADYSRHVVLVDEKIYDAIDYDFGNVPMFYISLDHKPAFVAPVEIEQKPILGD